MQDHDDRRAQGRPDQPRGGWPDKNLDDQPAQGDDGERHAGDPPYGDERTYGRQGQRGGTEFTHDAGGSYGQGDDSRSAQRSSQREGYRYADSGAAGQGDHGREQGAGGEGGYSGYGSSGKGQFGPGGFARGGYGESGYGGDYGQDLHGVRQARSAEAEHAPEPPRDGGED